MLGPSLSVLHSTTGVQFKEGIKVINRLNMLTATLAFTLLFSNMFAKNDIFFLKTALNV